MQHGVGRAPSAVGATSQVHHLDPRRLARKRTGGPCLPAVLKYAAERGDSAVDQLAWIGLREPACAGVVLISDRWIRRDMKRLGLKSGQPGAVRGMSQEGNRGWEVESPWGRGVRVREDYVRVEHGLSSDGALDEDR